MNYKKVYESIIQNRLENPLFKTVDGDYVENHHIKPRSFFPKGTSDKVMDKDNTVYLTAREHFVVHCLLAKMYEVGSSEWENMNLAMNYIIGKSIKHTERYINSRLYEYIKSKYYEQVNKDNEAECLVFICDICDWIDINNRIPNRSSSNYTEKRMSYKISTLKKAKKGYGSTNFYNSYQILIDQRGYSDLFNTIDNELLVLTDINEICDWMDINNGKKPNKRSINPIEKKMGCKINNLKQNKNKNKGRGKFIQSYQNLIEQRGYPNLFDIIDLEKEGLKNINKLCDWIDSNGGVLPKQNSKNESEKKMARKLHTTRQSKQGNKNWAFYNSFQELVEQRGYPKLLNITKNKKGT